eukprot:TRINITY_DN11643_c0_g1_i1.p1 TRINITY_DN11643_c0_g1~~TRINITY_DN11643_c0_g1_i1.p1  ORF type:complete len:324 (+),score=83.35 TRINITY_DN11643_c0_g1_i1:46-972(+)
MAGSATMAVACSFSSSVSTAFPAQKCEKNLSLRSAECLGLRSSFCSFPENLQTGSQAAIGSSSLSTLLRVVPSSTSRVIRRRAVSVMAATSPHTPPTVADTKAAFLSSYKKPLPSIYSNVIQELLVQQHLIRNNLTYKYDAVFALGFVTVYDQIMDGLPPRGGDADAIFKAYILALKENPEQYRKDAIAVEEWASSQDASTVADFAGKDGKVETSLKDISSRAAKNEFHYSRFFAIGLFRIVELAKASDPATLEKLCAALNVPKASVDRDLDVYRSLLTKLTAAKELLAEFLEREKKKQAEREAAKAT